MPITRFVWLSLCCAAIMALPCPAQKLAWSWANPLPHGNDVVDMAWNGTLGVQVCERGQIYTSPDLMNWSPQNSTLTNDLQAVTFFGKRIVVTGAFGAVAYSDDGTNFVAGSLDTANWIVAVAASPKLLVAVGDNGALYTSTDGARWGLQPPPPNLNGYWLLSVAWGNGLWVITGESGYIATSSNGTNWSSAGSLDTLSDGPFDIEKVVWCTGSGATNAFPYMGFWIATDNYTYSGDSYSFYSINNGDTWVPVNFVVPPTNSLYTIAADSTSVLLAGDSVTRLGSEASRIVTWPDVMGTPTNDVPPGAYYAAVVQTNGAYALAGADGLLAKSYLSNGTNAWTEPWYSPRDWLWQITVDDGLYVAVGDNARVMTSVGGGDWAVEDVPLTNSVTDATTFLCVGGTTNLVLAAGNDGSLATSPYKLVSVVDTNEDGGLATNLVSTLGIVWAVQPRPAGTTNDLAGIAVFNHQYFLVGGNGTLLSSPDATNWATLSAGTTNYLSGIAAFPSATATNALLVVTGNEGTLLTSTNGTNWLAHSTGTTNWLYRARAFPGRLLAVGENGALLTSTNATAWSALDSGVTNWLNDAVLISNTCYVVGNQGVVLTSTNFTNWTAASSITTKALESAATQNGQLIVVGFEGSILRSQIIPAPVRILQYAQADGYNVFSVAGPVDQSFNLQSSTNLVNWIDGPTLDLVYGDGTLIFYEPIGTPTPAGQYYRCQPVP